MQKDLHNLSNTYPIAVGRDNVCHECIEKVFSLELAKFRSGESITFYHGALKRNAIVYLELLVSLQDQPERRSADSIMLGVSTYTQLGGAIHSILCIDCTNWVTDDFSNALLWYSPPKNYPEIELQRNGKLGPLHLTYDVLKEAVSLTTSNISNGTWDKNVARAYLRVHGLNKDAIDGILRGAWESSTVD